MSTTSECQLFLMPNPEAPYSHQYFLSLTFEDTLHLEHSYPSLLPIGSVINWVFERSVCHSSQASTIQPFEFIPHYDDVREIIAEMPRAFGESMRSVSLTFLDPGNIVPRTVSYHFSKFRLIQEVCNYATPVSLSRQLLLHLRSHHLLPPHILEQFNHLRIATQIHGFYSTKFPLWKLGYFLGEEWLEDEVLDGLAEFLYFKTAATSIPLGIPPPFLYLPTSFFNDARVLFHVDSGVRKYSPNLEALRQRLWCTSVDSLGFLEYETNHFSGYITKDFHSLQHADSMHRAPAEDLLPVLQWVLSGLSIGVPSVVESATINRQGGDIGEGSCAVAAHNFLACSVDPTLNRWSAPTSRKVRDDLLRDFCIYNQVSSKTTGSFLDWVQSCVPNSFTLLQDTPSSKFCGYDDFNMFAPKRIHPIYVFLNEFCSGPFTQPRASNILSLLNDSPPPAYGLRNLGYLPQQLEFARSPSLPPRLSDQHFASLDDAIEAVYAEEESLGHKWVKGQTKRGSGGEHSTTIDPSNHRQGKSNKTNCKAHVNVIRDLESSQWVLNVPNWAHNHPPEIPSGGHASRPPTKAIRAAITAIASTTNIGRANVSKIIRQHPEYDQKHPLEPRQIGNVLSAARRTAREEVQSLSGDVNTIVTRLRAHADDTIVQNQLDSANAGRLIGPPAINRRGRPQTQRITGSYWKDVLGEAGQSELYTVQPVSASAMNSIQHLQQQSDHENIPGIMRCRPAFAPVLSNNEGVATRVVD